MFDRFWRQDAARTDGQHVGLGLALVRAFADLLRIEVSVDLDSEGAFISRCLLCALATLTGGLTVQKLHLAEFDMSLAAGVGIAVAVACRNLAAKRSHGGLWLIGYFALALGRRMQRRDEFILARVTAAAG